MVVIHKKHKETADERELRLKEEQQKAAGIQDEYQARGFELVSWVRHHKGLATLLVFAVFGLGGLLSAYFYYQNRTNEMASAAYMAALKDIDTLEKGAADEATKLKNIQDQLSAISQDYARSGVANLADLYAGHLALKAGDTQKALEFYKKAKDGFKQSDPFYGVALIGMGYAQDKNGDQKAALASFESLLEIKEVTGADLGLFEAARLAKEMGDLEKAKKYVSRLLEEYPASAYEKNAKKLKAEIKS